MDGHVEICFPGDEKHDERPGGQGGKNRLLLKGLNEYKWEKSPSSKL